MKKLIAILFILGILFSNTVTAKEDPQVSEQVKKSFHDRFPEAKTVYFETIKNATVVSFTDNYKHRIAVYQENGLLTGDGYYLSSEELPSKITHSLQERFGSFNVQESLAFFPEYDQSYYCARLATGKKTIIVKIYESGYTELVEKKIRF
jgi:hypothetical protein